MTDEVFGAAPVEASRKRLTPKKNGVAPFRNKALALGARGCSRAEIAAEFGCTRAVLRTWEQDHPTLAKALAEARDLELAWWEAKGREGIESGKLNATLWSRAMAGRFPDEGYGEKAAGPPQPPPPLRRTGPFTHRDRAKAVAALLAEAAARTDDDPAKSDRKGEH